MYQSCLFRHSSIYSSENSEDPKVLPIVAAVLPAEKLNETLVKQGLLPCCRLKKDELEAQGRRVLILRIPYSAVKNIGELLASRAKSLIRWILASTPPLP